MRILLKRGTRDSIISVTHQLERRSISYASSYDIMKKKLVVFGGNGYVGQHVCRSMLDMNYEVVSISRSGQPPNKVSHSPNWTDKVKFVSADVLNTPISDWESNLHGVDGVVSCIGAFGSNEYMEKINGDSNAAIASACKNTGVNNFVYVSAADNSMPEFFLKGYFKGKAKAEKAACDMFSQRATILRPGFIYGRRQVGSIELPLQLVGRPLEIFLNYTRLEKMSHLPGMSAFLTTPVSVEDVGLVAAAAASGIVRNDTVEENIWDGARIKLVAGNIRENVLPSLS
mmetsp:Transcript_21492/g.31200  ORF Transcript_21492/g.31200 Transcript_21492/m.31200 type:complete len:286 (-) Transcript_21492:164-1021(-)